MSLFAAIAQVGFWHIADEIQCGCMFAVRESGRDLLTLSSSGSDPTTVIGDQICCDAQYSPDRYHALCRARARQ